MSDEAIFTHVTMPSLTIEQTQRGGFAIHKLIEYSTSTSETNQKLTTQLITQTQTLRETKTSNENLLYQCALKDALIAQLRIQVEKYTRSANTDLERDRFHILETNARINAQNDRDYMKKELEAVTTKYTSYKSAMAADESARDAREKLVESLTETNASLVVEVREVQYVSDFCKVALVKSERKLQDDIRDSMYIWRKPGLCRTMLSDLG